MGRHNRTDKLKFALKRYIEAELCDYPETKEKLEDLRADIIYKSSLPEEGSQINARNNVSKPTERMAILLITNKRLEQMEKTVKAIEKVLGMLDSEKMELVRLKWWERKLTPIGIAGQMHIHEQTVYNWQRDVINLVAIEMGLANAADLL